MDGARRRPAPPRIEIGDAEIGRMQHDDASAFEGNTLVGDRHDVDLASMEQRCKNKAEKLAKYARQGGGVTDACRYLR